MQLLATPYWTGFVLMFISVPVFLIAYSARSRLMWLLRNWPWLLLGLAALAGIAELALNYADVLAWMARQLPLEGAASLLPTEGNAAPEWAAEWITAKHVAGAVLFLIVAVAIILAMLGKMKWKRVAILAFALAVIAFAAAFSADILAIAQGTPHQASKVLDSGLAAMRLTLSWVTLIFIALGGSILLFRSDVSVPEKLVAFGVIALLFMGGMQYLSNSDGTWTTYSSGPTIQRTSLAPAPGSPCDGYEVSYIFEASKPAVPFNKDGQCGPALWYEGHCIWVQGYRSDVPVRLCDKPGEPRGEFPLGAEYAWSADGYAFQDKYRLDPPRNTTLLNITPRRW